MKIALTFDDCYDSHLLFVKPLLEAYGFTATFFVSGHYLTCCKKFQPKHLVDFDRGGFELGNHLNAHIDMTKCGLQHNILQIKSVNDLFCKLGIETAISLAYPGYHVNNSTKEAVKRAGIKFARGGNDTGISGPGFKCNDDLLNIQCTGIFGKDYDFNNFILDLDKLNNDECGVFCFHDIVEEVKPGSHETTISCELFEKCMKHLKNRNCESIQLKDVG